MPQIVEWQHGLVICVIFGGVRERTGEVRDQNDAIVAQSGLWFASKF